MQCIGNVLCFKTRLFFAQRIGGLESAYIGNCPLARRLCFIHGGFFEIFLEIEIFYLSLMEAFPRKAKMPLFELRIFLAISRYWNIFKTFSCYFESRYLHIFVWHGVLHSYFLKKSVTMWPPFSYLPKIVFIIWDFRSCS